MKRHTESILLTLSLSLIGRILHLSIAGLVLVVCLVNTSFAVAADPPKATFEWKGRFNGDSPAVRPGVNIRNWIEGGWDVEIETELECEMSGIPGFESMAIRYYSVKSVSFKIPFQYITFPTDSLSDPVVENYLIVLDSSDFDLSYPPNSNGVPELETVYSGSWIYETYDVPIAGTYHYQIFLKHDAQRFFPTPRGATFVIGGGGGGSHGVQGGGFGIFHQSDNPENMQYGHGPDGCDFVPPAGYRYPFSLPYWYNTRKTDSLYGMVRFLDEEDESRLVVGAAADGRSRVIVEILGVQSSANVTIPDGDGTWVSGPIIQNGRWRRTWQAPESYGGSEDDSIQGRRPIGFAVDADDQSLAASPFNLYKAPVVLLHGLWDDASVWSPLQSALRAKGFRDYAKSYPPQASFFDNKLVVSRHTDHALGAVRDLALVAKKADVVGHSMGGCLAKNYGSQDYIRRIVTVGTPHYGSPLADALLDLDQSMHYDLELFLNYFDRTMYGGAIQDLRTGLSLPGNKPGIPVMAINGKADVEILPQSQNSNPLSVILRFFEDPVAFVHSSLFGTDTSDWVVSGNSQKGGLTGQNVRDVLGVWHLEEPGNAEVISSIIDFLNAPSDMVSIGSLSLKVEPRSEQKGIISQSAAAPMPAMAAGAETISITSPAAGTVFSPGDTVQVTVNTPAEATRVLVALSEGSVVVDDTPPFEMDIPIPQQSFGVMTIAAMAWDANGVVGTTSTTVTITTAATVTTLKVWPDSVLYLNAGETIQFVVHGIFSDGIERDITTSERGTTYNTTDSSVASIDTAGLLTAKDPGHCAVVISNGDSMQIPVTVTLSGTDRGYLVTSDLWIRAVINTEEKGAIDAVWQKGGEDTTSRGDRVIWGHFYASPSDVTWGSQNNPDLFVKIWFDVSGRVDVNFFHVSVPNIEVYSDYPYDGTVDEYGTTTMDRRYIRQYYENGQSNSDENYEDGNPPSGYSPTGNPSGYSTINDLRIGSIINTVEKGAINAVWQKGGEDTTSRGDQVVWGHFYASPSDVTWGSENNPDLFVKIWFDVSGRTDVNFFHVSVPDIEVYSDLPDDGEYDQKGTTVMENRYIRHEYWR